MEYSFISGFCWFSQLGLNILIFTRLFIFKSLNGAVCNISTILFFGRVLCVLFCDWSIAMQLGTDWSIAITD